MPDRIAPITDLGSYLSSLHERIWQPERPDTMLDRHAATVEFNALIDKTGRPGWNAMFDHWELEDRAWKAKRRTGHGGI